MRFGALFLILAGAALLSGAEPPPVPPPGKPAVPPPGKPGEPAEAERITQEQLLDRDKLLTFTSDKPCWLDKHKFFCCPIRKIVRRSGGEGRVTDYCYNARDELIGIRTHDSRGIVRKSDFRAVGGCTLCGATGTKTRYWRHNTNPKLAPPKKKKKK